MSPFIELTLLSPVSTKYRIDKILTRSKSVEKCEGFDRGIERNAIDLFGLFKNDAYCTRNVKKKDQTYWIAAKRSFEYTYAIVQLAENKLNVKNLEFLLES